jgi:hypothetical protein
MKLRDRMGLGRAASPQPADGTPAPRQVERPALGRRCVGRRPTVPQDRSCASTASCSSASTDALGRMDHDRATAELKSVVAQLIDEQTTPLAARPRVAAGRNPERGARLGPTSR